MCKHGYPNPDYDEADLITEEEALEAEVGFVTVDTDHYDQLVAKAAALDILTAHIKSYGKVNEQVVFAVTGIPKLEDQADQYYHWWCEEKDRVRLLEHELDETKALLNTYQLEREPEKEANTDGEG